MRDCLVYKATCATVVIRIRVNDAGLSDPELKDVLRQTATKTMPAHLELFQRTTL